MEWWVFQLASIAAVPLASHMAFERDRSCKAWAWTAVLIGPFAPFVLLALGDAKHPVRAD